MKVREAVKELQSMPDEAVKFGYRAPDGSVIEATSIEVDEVTGIVVVD
jgi:hypothetical protein